MWKCSEKHEAPWKYKSSLLSLSSLVLQSTGELYRKARQSGSESRERRSSKNPLFWGGWVLCTSFFPGKKNLNNQNTEKRKEQRVTLLQVITIYYRNSSDAQFFWLQPWWAERGRRRQRGGIFCALLAVDPRTKWLWEIMCLSPISAFLVTTWSTNCLKLIFLSNHVPLQSCPSPAFLALQPTKSKQTPPHHFTDFFSLPSQELQIELSLSQKNQSFPWDRPLRTVMGGVGGEAGGWQVT